MGTNLASTAIPPLANTWGAVLIGVILSSTLFGILTSQTYHYYRRFDDDPLWLKRVIAIVWILDLLHEVAVVAISYSHTVGHFNDPSYISRNNIAVSTALLLEPMTAVIVQLYFARRNWLLNKKNLLMSIIIVATAVISFICGETCAIITYSMERFSDFQRYPFLVVIWLAGSGVCDVLVTATVAWTLWTSKTGFTDTDRLITRVVVWTINTGALTSTAAILDLIVFTTEPNNLIHLAFNFALSKLYSNMLLGSLNRRSRGICIDSQCDTIGPPILSEDVALPAIHSRRNPTRHCSNGPDISSDVGSNASSTVINITRTGLISADLSRTGVGDIVDEPGPKPSIYSSGSIRFAESLTSLDDVLIVSRGSDGYMYATGRALSTFPKT